MTTEDKVDGVKAQSNDGASVPEAPADSELTRLRQEVQDLKDRNLRLLAEQRNQQQRVMREQAQALKHAEADFARDLLVVLDDLERTQASAAASADAATLAEGVRIGFEHFLKILKDHGVTPIAAQGQPFDPGQHEALLQQPSAEVPAGHVLQEAARGYRMHERVIRPARVIVSSGPGAAGG
jgi:molecular chaperone GrpE